MTSKKIQCLRLMYTLWLGCWCPLEDWFSSVARRPRFDSSNALLNKNHDKFSLKCHRNITPGPQKPMMRLEATFADVTAICGHCPWAIKNSKGTPDRTEAVAQLVGPPAGGRMAEMSGSTGTATAVA